MECGCYSEVSVVARWPFVVARFHYVVDISNYKLEMWKYDIDAPAQVPSSPGPKHFAKNEDEKGPWLS